MTRDDVYYLLIRRLAWLDALLTPEQKTQLDGDLWFVASEIVHNIDRPGVPEGYFGRKLAELLCNLSKRDREIIREILDVTAGS